MAIVNGATAIAAELMPTCERIERVIMRPSETTSSGQTLLKLDEARLATSTITRRYLQARRHLGNVGLQCGLCLVV